MNKFGQEDIISALKSVFDPEIPVNVWDLGLIYDIDIKDKNVFIKMTLTSLMCPMAQDIIQMVQAAAESVAGAGNAKVNLVWDPPWSPDRMSQTAKLELDLTNQGW